MILINKTFCEINPDSAENGESSDSGFVFENVEYTFKELIDELEKHKNASCYPVRASVQTWFSSDFAIDDYSTMTERQESIHYSKDNIARSAKYWNKAINYVFNIKG